MFPARATPLAISSKLGLPDYIIDEARNHLKPRTCPLRTWLTSLESSRLTIEKEQAEINAYKDEIAKLKSRLTQKEERLDERKDKVIRSATEEAQRILREAKETADQTIKQINKLTAGAGINKELEEQRSRLRDQLKKTDDKLAVKARAKPAHLPEEVKDWRRREGIVHELKGHGQHPAQCKRRPLRPDGYPPVLGKHTGPGTSE